MGCYWCVIFQIPQICHFVLLCAVPLGLSGIPVYELERSFLMPRESSALQRVMTSLLSTPFQRTRSASVPLAVFLACCFGCKVTIGL